MRAQPQGPLEGIRILSLSTGIAAPYAGRILAQCGAEVIKIESRAGGIDSFRYFGDGDDLNASTRFAETNFGLRSLTLNLKHPDGLRIARELVAKSDVVMDNFRADVLDNLGIGPAAIQAVNPAAIVVKMPGMGSTGPRSGYGTWGATLNAFAGLTYLWNHPGQPRPVGAQGSYPDYLAAVMASMIVAAALVHRRRTGKAVTVDLAQVEVAAYALGVSYLEASVNGRAPVPEGNSSPTGAPAGAFRCRGQERWCAVVVESDAQWRALARVIGRPDLALEPRFADATGRRAGDAEIGTAMAAWFEHQDAEDAAARLQAAGIPAGVVQTGEDLVADPQLLHRRLVRSVRQPGIGMMRAADIPLRLEPAPLRSPSAAPRLGEHTWSILTSILGYTPAEVRRLRADKVIV